MSYGEPWGAVGNGAAMDETTIARQLSPDEALGRLQVARSSVLWPVLGWTLGGAIVVLILAVGLITHWSIGWILGAVLPLVVTIAAAVGLGLLLGNQLLRRQAAYELGGSGVLSVTWGERGATVTAENLRRTFGYHEVKRVYQHQGFVVLRLPLQWHAAPYVLAFPPDFVPAEAVQRMLSAGARAS